MNNWKKVGSEEIWKKKKSHFKNGILKMEFCENI
jgi:hypothetical protein